MAQIKKDVFLDIELVLGRTSPDRYLYFVDSTMARFWLNDYRLEKVLIKYLEEITEGRILTNEERFQFGINSNRFGTTVFLWMKGTYSTLTSTGKQKTFMGELTAMTPIYTVRKLFFVQINH